MTETVQEMRGIGYLESVLSVVELTTVAKAIKEFALKQHVTEQTEEGDILNGFVGILIQKLDLDEFEVVAPQLFSYPIDYQGNFEVEEISASREELIYLKENINRLLQKK